MSKRDHLVKTAQQLFYKQGIRATGIDTILMQSGVAKKTLYNHFKSKNELIIAALQRRDEEFMAMLQQGIKKYRNQQTGNPLFFGVMAFFDTLLEWTTSDDFCGCMFINASAEFPQTSDPIHLVCQNHKHLVIQFIAELLASDSHVDAIPIAKQLALLADGAIVNAHTTNNIHAAQEAKQLARILLENNVAVKT